MELSSFVRIFDGDQLRGTGYRLSRDRVLTALHVVDGAGDVRVELARDDRVEASVLWRGDLDRGLDVAVLACEPDDDEPVGFAQLAPEPLSRKSRWSSWGCAVAGAPEKSGRDGMVPLDGTAYPKTPDEEHLRLKADAWPVGIEGWQGISGAPVFVGGRIHGVIRQGPKGFGGQLIDATPMHRLLADEGFAKAVRREEASKWEKIRADICRLLEDESDATRAIADGKEAWQEAFAVEGAEGLTAALERSTVDEVLLALHKAHGSLVGTRAAKTVVKVLEILVPLLYDRQLAFSPPGGVVLRVPVATPTVAEMAMAGVDARALRYRPVRDPKTMPEPLAQVPKTLETGIDYEGARAFKDFVDHLGAQFLDEEPRRLLQSQSEERRYEQLAGLVNDEIDWKAGAGGGLRHYFLFDSSFALDHQPLLELLHELLPALRLVELTSDDVRSDRRLCLPLRDLLYGSQTHGKTDDEIP